MHAAFWEAVFTTQRIFKAFVFLIASQSLLFTTLEMYQGKG